MRRGSSLAGIAAVLLLTASCGPGADSPDESFATGLAHAEQGAWQDADDTRHRRADNSHHRPATWHRGPVT